MGTITSANAVFTLVVASIFPTPQQIQGFATDDAFAAEKVQTAEVTIGVDGRSSAGYTPYLTPMGIHLQADSASNDFFDAWAQAEKAAMEKFPAMGIITLSSIKKKFTLTTGWLNGLIPIAPAAKVLRPRDFTITWGSVDPLPFTGGGG